MSSEANAAFDFVVAIGDAVHRRDRALRRLEDLKGRAALRCGNCQKWMKSRDCPRERPGTGKRSGFSVGPSMTEPACAQYQATPDAAAAKTELMDWAASGYSQE
jgi:hypothetical protein